MYFFTGITSKIKSKLLLISLNLFLLHSIYAGDIEQILPPDSNFTIDGDGSLEVMRVQSDGLVGIGTTTPNEKLEVNGHIRMTNGNEAANTVMIGDAAGTASWADISTIQDGTGTDNQNLTLVGNVLTLQNGGTVDLTPYLDNTDDQNITTFTLETNNTVTLTLENGKIVSLKVRNFQTPSNLRLHFATTLYA